MYAPVLIMRKSSITVRNRPSTSESVAQLDPSLNERAQLKSERAPSLTERTPSLTELTPSLTERTPSLTDGAQSLTEVTELAQSLTELAQSLTELAQSQAERAPSLWPLTERVLRHSGNNRSRFVTDSLSTRSVTERTPSLTERAPSRLRHTEPERAPSLTFVGHPRVVHPKTQGRRRRSTALLGALVTGGSELGS